MSSDEEDLHQCGRCKEVFKLIDAYFAHKKSKVCKKQNPAETSKPDGAVLQEVATNKPESGAGDAATEHKVSTAPVHQAVENVERSTSETPPPEPVSQSADISASLLDPPEPESVAEPEPVVKPPKKRARGKRKLEKSPPAEKTGEVKPEQPRKKPATVKATAPKNKTRRSVRNKQKVKGNDDVESVPEIDVTDVKQLPKKKEVKGEDDEPDGSKKKGQTKRKLRSRTGPSKAIQALLDAQNQDQDSELLPDEDKDDEDYKEITGNLPEEDDEEDSVQNKTRRKPGRTPLAKTLECDICHEMFAREPMLRRHKRNMHPSNNTLRRFTCDMCNEQFPKRMLLLKHLHQKHGIDDEHLENYSCPVCDRSFNQKSHVLRHRETLHTPVLQIPPLEIPNVEERSPFGKSGILTVDQVQKTAEGHFECFVCKKLFSSFDPFKRHLDMHRQWVPDPTKPNLVNKFFPQIQKPEETLANLISEEAKKREHEKEQEIERVNVEIKIEEEREKAILAQIPENLPPVEPTPSDIQAEHSYIRQYDKLPAWEKAIATELLYDQAGEQVVADGLQVKQAKIVQEEPGVPVVISQTNATPSLDTYTVQSIGGPIIVQISNSTASTSGTQPIPPISTVMSQAGRFSNESNTGNLLYQTEEAVKQHLSSQPDQVSLNKSDNHYSTLMTQLASQITYSAANYHEYPVTQTTQQNIQPQQQAQPMDSISYSRELQQGSAQIPPVYQQTSQNSSVTCQQQNLAGTAQQPAQQPALSTQVSTLNIPQQLSVNTESQAQTQVQTNLDQYQVADVQGQDWGAVNVQQNTGNDSYSQFGMQGLVQTVDTSAITPLQSTQEQLSESLTYLNQQHEAPQESSPQTAVVPLGDGSDQVQRTEQAQGVLQSSVQMGEYQTINASDVVPAQSQMYSAQGAGAAGVTPLCMVANLNQQSQQNVSSKVTSPQQINLQDQQNITYAEPSGTTYKMHESGKEKYQVSSEEALSQDGENGNLQSFQPTVVTNIPGENDNPIAAAFVASVLAEGNSCTDPQLDGAVPAAQSTANPFTSLKALDMPIGPSVGEERPEVILNEAQSTIEIEDKVKGATAEKQVVNIEDLSPDEDKEMLEEDKDIQEDDKEIPEDEGFNEEDVDMSYLVCSYCNQTYDSMTTLYQHKVEDHNLLCVFQCIQDKCKLLFFASGDFFEHAKEHCQRAFICQICNFHTAHLDAILGHKSASHRNINKVGPNVCQVCHLVFKDKDEWQKHVDEGNHDQSHFKCNECNKVFKNASYLKIHKDSHSVARPYLCDMCGSTFQNYSSLARHRLIHNAKRSHQCPACDKAFVKREHLRRHITTKHTDERPFKCPECPKAFKRVDKLKDHLRMHSRETPYVCHLCGKGYRYREGLRYHIRAHERPCKHSCQLCGLGFSRPSILRNHLSNTHGIQVRDSHLYQCNYCPNTFSRPERLKRHVERDHNLKVKWSFKCEICGRGYPGKKSLNSHMLKRHNSPVPGMSPPAKRKGKSRKYTTVREQLMAARTEVYNVVPESQVAAVGQNDVVTDVTQIHQLQMIEIQPMDQQQSQTGSQMIQVQPTLMQAQNPGHMTQQSVGPMVQSAGVSNQQVVHIQSPPPANQQLQQSAHLLQPSSQPTPQNTVEVMIPQSAQHQGQEVANQVQQQGAQYTQAPFQTYITYSSYDGSY